MKYALNTRHENKEEKPRINPYVFISKTILIKNSLENSKEIRMTTHIKQIGQQKPICDYTLIQTNHHNA